MFLNRNLLLAPATLIGAAIVDGVFAAGIGSPARAWMGWPIVGGLAVLVIAALVVQVQAAAYAADDREAEAYFAEVNGQTALLAAALVIVGIALLLGTTAPGMPTNGVGMAFPAWAGVVTVLMGFVLAITKRAIGVRKTANAGGPWAPNGGPWAPNGGPWSDRDERHNGPAK